MTANDLLKHFKIPLPEDPYPELDEDSIIEKLDGEIVFQEIRNAVKDTKNKKSCGPVMILTETFKYYMVDGFAVAISSLLFI